MPGFSVNFNLVTQPSMIQQQWLDLQARSECSYFQSWGWVNSWLDKVVADQQVLMLQVCSGQELVGLGLFVPAEISRRMIIRRSKALYLNEYPFDGKNMVIEYNGILAARGFEQAVYAATVRYFSRELKHYNEFNFGGLLENTDVSYLIDATDPPLKFSMLEESNSWTVELSSIHETPDQYLSSLSKNRRGQIRRSIRLYEERGPVSIRVAETPEEAMVYFSELEVLHTRRWQKQGEPGVFANPVWKSFHSDLVSKRFNQGEIQLIKVSCADQAIGYLYNYVWQRKIYVLQTGFESQQDSRFMPGYVTHVFAVVHNYGLGMTEYDFLHGDDLYKKILSNKQQKLCWAVLQRPRLKFRLENIALLCIRACRRYLQ